jgi:hypothetical protein
MNGPPNASVRKEWESKVQNVEINLGTAAAKFDAGVASLPILQRQHQQPELGWGMRMS